MTTSTGGPAFPWCGDLNECPTINLGMTLRDYFAAKAMVQLSDAWDWDQARARETSARIAYAMADAMLRAREAT